MENNSPPARQAQLVYNDGIIIRQIYFKFSNGRGCQSCGLGSKMVAAEDINSPTMVAVTPGRSQTTPQKFALYKRQENGNRESSLTKYNTQFAESNLTSTKAHYENTQATKLSHQSSTGGDSSSSVSEYETDSEEDESTSNPQDIDLSCFSKPSCSSPCINSEDVINQVLSPMKQALLDRMMSEFWVIFNQENDFI